jgi:hypothetical protein
MKLLQFLRSPSVRKQTHRIVAFGSIAFFFGFTLLGIYLIAFRLNFLQIDLAGHLASAVSFYRFGLHGWNDSFFLGSIQNLFYPPLEDVLLGGLIHFVEWIGVSDPILAFQAYLITVWVAYSVSLFLLSRRLKYPSFALLGFAVLLALSKETSVTYQGLSLMDLVRTGLTSQFLGGIFFVLLLKELLFERRSQRVVIWLVLAILSHIVMGFVAMCLWAALAPKRISLKGCIQELLLVLGTTAFFWIPFVAYRGYLEAGKVVITPHLELSLVAITSFLLFLRTARLRWVLLLCALLLLPNTLGTLIPTAYDALPVFHYYRFVMPVLLILWTVFNLEFLHSRFLSMSAFLCCLVILGIVAHDSRFMQVDLLSTYYTPAKVSQVSLPPLSGIGRVWTIGKERTSDFGLDSYLAVLDPGYRAVKGLFWESSRSNSLLSSFMATFLGPHGVVLPHQFFEGINCEQTQCMMNRFFSVFGVERIILDRELVLPYLRSPRRSCMEQIFQKDFKIGDHRLEQVGGLQDEEVRYVAYKMNPPVSQARVVPMNSLKMIRNHGLESLRVYLDSCLESGTPAPTLIPERARGEIEAAMHGDHADAVRDFSVVRQSSGDYRFDIPTSRPSLFHLPISFLPGLKLQNDRKELLPIFESYPGLLGVGSGRMQLQYHRPFWMWVGYAITASMLVWIMARLFLNGCIRQGQKQSE